MDNIIKLNSIEKVALVTEGGGQKGIFTAGVLDAWQMSNYNPFNIFIGTSAGAQNISGFLSGEVGLAKDTIIKSSENTDFFSIKRSLKGGSSLDLDWHISNITKAAKTICNKRLHINLQQSEVYFTATKSKCLGPVLLKANAENWIEVLKASSAVPYLYKKGVSINGEYYIDGAVCTPVPVKEAYNLGATKIITIRTVSQCYNANTKWAHIMKSWTSRFNRDTRALDIITKHENSYAQMQDFIKKPPKNVEIIEIFPPEPLSTKLFGSCIDSIKKDYKMGLKAGNDYLRNNLFDTSLKKYTIQK